MLALLFGLFAGSGVTARQRLSSSALDRPANQTIFSDAELFDSSTEQLRSLLMPDFTGEIVDSALRNLHPGSNKLVTLYEPMKPISSLVCKQTTHSFWFRQSWDRDSHPSIIVPNGRVLTNSHESAIYLAAQDSECVKPPNGVRGFESNQVDVGETLAKYQAILNSREPQAVCNRDVQNCAALFKSIPLASLRSLYGCHSTDCIAEFDFPDPNTGMSPWGWTVKLFGIGGTYRVDIRRAYPPPVS